MHYFVREQGLVPYEIAWRSMQKFTEQRTPETVDEIWLLQHPAVYTQGLVGKPEHILQSSDIPLIQTDRGGQITYHGPGQLIVYLLLDIQRKNLNVRSLVDALEKAVIDLLADYQIQSHTKQNAPGVYVNNNKVASIGLRIKRGCSYHGLSLNVNMDLEPFNRINPCGYQDLKLVNLGDLGGPNTPEAAMKPLMAHLSHHLGYTSKEIFESCKVKIYD